MACHHPGVHQVAYNAFECHDCRMVFFGVDRRDHRFQALIDSMHISGSQKIDPNILLSPSPYPTQTQTREIPVVHVDLGSVPEDVTLLKAKMDELERTLSLFADILKHAVQS